MINNIILDKIMTYKFIYFSLTEEHLLEHVDQKWEAIFATNLLIISSAA
jgi:hypothetical protein